MTAQRLIAITILVGMAVPALAETGNRVEAFKVAQGLAEEAPGERLRTATDAYKKRMGEIANDMSSPDLDPHTRERLRIQYQNAVRDYRASLSNKK